MFLRSMKLLVSRMYRVFMYTMVLQLIYHGIYIGLVLKCSFATFVIVIQAS